MCFRYRNTRLTNSPQAVAAVREEDLLLLGVLPGHARRMLLRLPSLHTATLPVDEGTAAAAAAANTTSAPPQPQPTNPA